MLLRLEKYHYRMNFARGILESRNVTYDKSMRRLAKPLPLDTPTVIELSPENKIRVTLFDANHCVGAVMFLIEGSGKAILYTGDIRAETWWVNSLVQNPVLVPYTIGSRRLDCIYLDTTFATKSEPYREFPSKAEGIRELLAKVEQYPKDTVFYFRSWTFGYENVWIALSTFLDSQIHLDEYRARIYGSLSSLNNKSLKDSGFEIREGPALCGFRNGNHIQPGCLTPETNVRIHSCEPGMGCPVMDDDTHANVVHIIPIVTRFDGTEIAELGAGGGKGDLDQTGTLDTVDAAEVGKLMELCASKIDDAQLLSKVLGLLQDALSGGIGKIDLNANMQKESQDSDDDFTLQTLVSILAQQVEDTAKNDQLHRTIRFPFSRHSSYSELCTLVNTFNPKDVFPCTVDEQDWSSSVGMRTLFSHCCSADIFRHDAEMMAAYEARQQRDVEGKRDAETQLTSEDEPSQYTPENHRQMVMSNSEVEHTHFDAQAPDCVTPTGLSTDITFQPSNSRQNLDTVVSSPIKPSAVEEVIEVPRTTPNPIPGTSSVNVPSSTRTTKKTTLGKSRSKRSNRQIAYDAALGNGLTWADYGGLISTRNRSDREEEL
jgi:hypothetical protein